MEAVKRFFQALWRGWKAVGKFIGDIIGRVVLMVLYLTLVLPFGLGARFFSDHLEIRKNTRATWRERTSPEATIEVSYNQF